MNKNVDFKVEFCWIFYLLLSLGLNTGILKFLRSCEEDIVYRGVYCYIVETSIVITKAFVFWILGNMWDIVGLEVSIKLVRPF